GEYLAAVMEIEVPDGATKEQKKQIKDYNKALKERRETAAPPVYEPLLLNCDLFFALTEARPLSQAERATVEGILFGNGRPVFLSDTIGARYGLVEIPAQFEAGFEKDEFTIPASLVSERSVIRVTVTEGGQDAVYEDWNVDSVDRPEDDFESFTVTFSSEEAEDQEWSADSVVKVEIFDEADTKYEPVVVEFRVSEYQKILFIETVKFEKVS
ncbi:MAG: hypothetical protein II290_01260, partial [Oscillospiraceae bacterium]|nr:hypothetical protein [Oscillospiraceae bacterium]